jgi:hypothetical protein
MNRHATALFAALEALLVVGVGVALPLVPLTALWAGQYDLQVDWGVFARTAVDLWLLGHGVPLTASLDPALAAALGLPTVDAPFALTLAPLGFALLTLLLGIRAGRRIVETDHPGTGVLAAIGTTAALSLGLALAAQHEGVAPAIVRGAVLPTLVLALGLLIGGIARVDRARAGRWWASLSSGRAAGAIRGARDALDRLPEGALSVAATAVRGGAAAAFAVVAISAVVVAVLLGLQYATVITLYETLQTGIVGGVALTLGQLALLPNLVVWASSWLVGPGFALGSGSSVSPLGTSVGPLPEMRTTTLSTLTAYPRPSASSGSSCRSSSPSSRRSRSRRGCRASRSPRHGAGRGSSRPGSAWASSRPGSSPCSRCSPAGRPVPAASPTWVRPPAGSSWPRSSRSASPPSPACSCPDSWPRWSGAAPRDADRL